MHKVLSLQNSRHPKAPRTFRIGGFLKFLSDVFSIF